MSFFLGNVCKRAVPKLQLSIQKLQIFFKVSYHSKFRFLKNLDREILLKFQSLQVRISVVVKGDIATYNFILSSAVLCPLYVHLCIMVEENTEDCMKYCYKPLYCYNPIVPTRKYTAYYTCKHYGYVNQVIKITLVSHKYKIYCVYCISIKITCKKLIHI